MPIVINSKFRPYTFDELARPLLQYKEAYDKTSEDYSNLATQTERWKDIANRENSPEAYEMFNKYSTELNDVIDDFSNGMTIKNRSKLLNMKKRYASDIVPIAEASAAMKEANELRTKLGSDAIFEVNKYNSLDSFLHGKTANNTYQSKEALTKKTAALTEAAMATALQNPEFQKVLGDQYWLLTQHTGGSYEDLKEAIANNPEAQNIFSEIKNQVLKDSNYMNYDLEGRKSIEEAINTGLYAGLDRPTKSFQANQGYLNPYQKQQMDLSLKEYNLKLRDRQPLSLGDDNYLDPVTGLTFTTDEQGNRVYDLTYKKNPNSSNRTSSGSGSGSTNRVNRLEKSVIINTGGNNDVSEYEDKPDLSGFTPIEYSQLNDNEKVQADILLRDDIPDGYAFFRKPGGLLNHSQIAIVPTKVSTINNDVDENMH